MNFLLSDTVENMIFITAIINIVGVLWLFFSCRFVSGRAETQWAAIAAPGVAEVENDIIISP
jgi:hypothetical protein